MNSLVRIFVLALIFVTITSEEQHKLFDLNTMYEMGTLDTFLAQVKDGQPVKVEQCLDNPTFKPSQITVDPPAIVKGKSIKINVLGVMLSDQIVAKLHLDTYLNGAVIYNADVDKKNQQVPKGMYKYDYEASVPTFTPSGNWEIYVHLLSSSGVELNCIRASFTMP